MLLYATFYTLSLSLSGMGYYWNYKVIAHVLCLGNIIFKVLFLFLLIFFSWKIIKKNLLLEEIQFLHAERFIDHLARRKN